jgi:hypothetical protein
VAVGSGCQGGAQPLLTDGVAASLRGRSTAFSHDGSDRGMDEARRALPAPVKFHELCLFP